MEAQPGFKPAFARQREAEFGIGGEIGNLIGIDGEKIAYGGAIVLAVFEGFLAAEHKQAAAALADEILHELHLILGEKFGFDVVEDEGVVFEKFVGGFGEAGLEFVGVIRCRNE